MYGSPLVSVYSGAMIGRRPGGWSCCCELVDRERGTWLRKGLFGRSGSAGVSPELVAFLRMLSQNFIEEFKFLHVFSFVCLAYDQLRPGILSFCNSLLLLRFTGYVVFLVQFCFWQRIRSCLLHPAWFFWRSQTWNKKESPALEPLWNPLTNSWSYGLVGISLVCASAKEIHRSVFFNVYFSVFLCFLHLNRCDTSNIFATRHPWLRAPTKTPSAWVTTSSSMF